MSRVRAFVWRNTLNCCLCLRIALRRLAQHRRPEVKSTACSPDFEIRSSSLLMLPPKTIFIDHNVWDFLLARRLDLATELPPDRFSLWITREAEFEIKATPDEKVELKAFVATSIAAANVRTQSYFGFHEAQFSDEEQRVGGFNVGWWATQPELDFIGRLRGKMGKLMKTRLYDEEADISLGARSLVATVLTLDGKKGPLRLAHREGGDVIYLSGFDASGQSLADFICSQSRRP